MQPSRFNVHVPLAARDEVFLMNTLTDAQILVSKDVATLLDRLAADSEAAPPLSHEEREAVAVLTEHGFLVADPESEQRALDDHFRRVREDRSQLRVTVLTTLQCNFACDYCYQGDRNAYNAFAAKMSLETAAQVVEWVESRLDEVKPESFGLTFFGGEPLLNQPVMYFLAERLWVATQARGIGMSVSVITNGLLLTPEVVDRLAPYGLQGIKVTIDGDRETHNRMRPLRGGQGTFDKILDNVRRVAGRCRITIGGNFDETSVGSYPALLDYLKAQPFADDITRVSFKPIIRNPQPSLPRGTIPLTAVGDGNKPLGGTCMTTAGSGTGVCDTCHFLDEKMALLREETKRRGFATHDGVHMGPCEIHQRHAHTVGPDGSLYACPGFTGEPSLSTGHIDGRRESWRERAVARFERLAAWEQCRDCAFIPVCAGGCTTAAHTELGDLDRPNCHKPSFEAGVVALAHEAAGTGAAATGA